LSAETKTVPVIVEHQSEEIPAINDDELISAEVQFMQVMPEQGQFEVILTDSDDKTSSDSGTPIQQRLRILPHDARSSSTPSPRVHSPTSSDVIVYGADQWKETRREVLDACKPRPSGWLWMENQANDVKHSEEVSSASETTRSDFNGYRVEGATPGVTSEISTRRSSYQTRQSQSNSAVTSNKTTPSANANFAGESQATNQSIHAPLNAQSNTVSVHSDNYTKSVHSTTKSSEHPRPVPAGPKPPPRTDSVKSYEVVTSSKSYELQTSSNVISSRESLQFARSQHFANSEHFQDSSNDRREESCITSYRVQLEEGKLPGDGYRPPVGLYRDTSGSIHPCAASERPEPAAVDALFTYHHMPSTTAVTPTSSLSARCNPAAKSPQGGSPTAPTSATLRTHF
jgi:hypothetical protein